MTPSLPQIQHNALASFSDVARSYCRIVEDRGSLTPSDFLAAIHSSLPCLYSAALALPDTDVLFPDDGDEDAYDHEPREPNPARGTDDEARDLRHSLHLLIGERDYYREIFDPFEPVTEKEVTGWLSDDLVDIYRDLKGGLDAWERGESGEALWEWRFLFEVHWGEHATSALRVFHVLCSTYDSPWPKPSP